MTPIARAEKFLGARLQSLERQLPLDGSGDSSLWMEYIWGVLALTTVRGQLYPGRTVAPLPPRSSSAMSGGAHAPPRRPA
jgi:hypothetical protein